MSKLYFTTEWVVRPVTPDTLRHVLHVAGRLNCLLYQHGSSRNDAGFFVVPFVIRVPSRTALDQFIHEAGARMGLTEWTPATAEDFHGAPFMGSRIGGFVEASAVYGRANTLLRQREDDDQPAQK